MDDPTNYAIFRDCEISARVIPGHRQLCRMGLDQPQADRLGSFLTVGRIDGDALPLRQTHDPGTLQRRGVYEDIFAAVIQADEAEALGGVVPLYRARLLDRRSIG
jgi:hypothetical protein